MFRCFFPDEYLDSAYEIDYERLYEEGYRGLIYDIDNTLVPHGAPADERAIALFDGFVELALVTACCQTIRLTGWHLLQMRFRPDILKMPISRL